MLSGLKFVPREQIEKVKDEVDVDSRKQKHKSGRGRRKDEGRMGKRKSSCSSSDEEAFTEIKRSSRKKKKRYDLDQDLSSGSDTSSSQSGSASDSSQKKKRLSRKRDKKRRSNRKESSRSKERSTENESEKSTEERTNTDANIVRKEMGLEWMLRGKEDVQKPSPDVEYDIKPEEVLNEQVNRHNPRELNPYFKDNGSGYPEEFDGVKGGNKHLSSNVIGDGGASWRLKALKRAQEQAAREGRKFQEVVEERWGSMGNFAASVPSNSVAPTHAHLHAIKQRRKGLTEDVQKKEKDTDQKSTLDVTPRHPKMRLPNVPDSLSWGKRGKKHLSHEDSALLSAAMSNVNKFSDDGSFMEKFATQKSNNSDDPGDSSFLKFEGKTEPMSVTKEDSGGTKEDSGSVTQGLSANQLAAKAMQLRMKGKHDESEKLLKEAEKIRLSQSSRNESSRSPVDGTTSRFILHDVSVRQKGKDEDADLHLAKKIMHNHRYNVAGQADEEYDYEDGPKRKTRKQGGDGNNKASEINNSAKRILTQQERCQFCFENPKRPKHLVLAIANFTYLALSQRQSVVPGHCCILTLQHEMSTRTIDDNVWDEFRNFKKCLIMMFAEQEKDVVFLETVMGLGQQKRHCMVECIPLPRKIAKQAPVYFKKAIDEAEDEWSQHNAKKLIDTSEKGLRASIPANFPYFHVEFGIKRGFVHVIDNEREFKSDFGINVIRGMLRLPAEDMHRRQRQESLDSQRQSVASFLKDWQPFDWTKQLS